ncbi:MAG TPA: type I polyketide synthase, partial [Planctomycetota bacterium]|nr:type I polyketide synthase [Planctomycetota bacterium]
RIEEGLEVEPVARDGANRIDGALEDTPESVEIDGAAREPEPHADDLDGFWGVLEGAVDTVRPIPGDRFDLESFFDPDPEAKDKTYAREAALLDHVDLFDASFFGISPREAKHIDPQHRLLLEATWEGLETAGIVPAALTDSTTGVFVGIGPSDYSMAEGAGRTDGSDAFTILGTQACFAAGRLAFTLGLQGPALSVDTACSSSLVALHLGCKALRRGECTLALAAGVQVLAAPESFIALSRTRALAADGRSKTFSATADGYGRGEGAVVLVLERLRDARLHGRRILAVVRGSAVNHDGRSSGITAPNGSSQQKVLRAALEDAQLHPHDVDAIECHGTGTALGDPIEVNALAAVYARGRSEGPPLLLGALKTNIGHLEAASGLAGVAKVLAAFQNEALPPTLHASPRNALIDWDALSIRVVDALLPWPRRDDSAPRRAAVSAFGLSGTNAHVILEDAPSAGSEPRADHALPLPFVLSAKSDAALREQAQRLRAHLDRRADLPLADIAFSLATTRSHFDVRAGVVVPPGEAGRRALGEALEALAGGQRPAGTVRDAATSGKLAILFSGQGSQRPGMGRGLYDAFPVFREAFDAAFAELDPHLERPLREVVFAEPGSDDAAHLDQTAFTQPALFALEVALFRLLESWGMTPDLLLGHSVGELVAAHVAGVLSLPDACALVAARARLMQVLPVGGAMTALQATEDEVRSLLSDGVDIAAINGPSATVVSGDEEAVRAVAARVEALGRKVKHLRVSHAFHSSRMDPMLEDFRAVVRTLTFHPPRIPIVSNVTGALARADELASSEYWVRHVRAAVRFADGVRTLEAQGVSTFLELGPTSVLTAMAAESAAAEALGGAAFLPTLRGERPEALALTAAVAALHARGHALDWGAFFAPWSPRAVALPTYAFQRQRYWHEARLPSTSHVADAGLSSAEHPLLGAAVALADGHGQLFTGRLSLRTHAWIAAHSVYGAVLVPGTGVLEMALLAANRLGMGQVEELVLEAPLALSGAAAVHLQLTVAPPDEAGRRALALYGRTESESPDAPWVRHATGALGPAAKAPSVDLSVWPPPGAVRLETDGLYERLAAAGFTYGPEFQGLRAVWRRERELFVETELPPSVAPTSHAFGLHPALLDAALHALAFDADEGAAVGLPFSWTGVTLHAAGASRVRVRIARQSADSLALTVADDQGQPVASVDGLLLRALAPSALQAGASQNDALFQVTWTELAAPERAKETGPWALVGAAEAGLLGALGAAVGHVDAHRDLASLE